MTGLQMETGKKKKGVLKNRQFLKYSLGRPRGFSHSDMSRSKRVKFADTVSNIELSGRENGTSSFQTHSPVGDVKTSELKFFKRLLEKTNSKCQLFHNNQDTNNSKQFRTGDHMEENNDSLQKYNVQRTLLPIQMVTPTAPKTSMSPSTISHNCELYTRTKFKQSACSSFRPIRNVTPVARMPSLLDDVLLNSGPEHEYRGVFQVKRKNLLRLAAEASSQKVDEILSNKSDVISEFLQRLGTERNSSNPFELPKSGQKVSRGRCHSLAPSKSYNGEKELLAVRTDLPTVRKSMGKELLAYRCNEAEKSNTWQLDYVDDQEFPEWDAFYPGLPWQRWKSHLAFNTKGNLDLLPDYKSPSVVELGKTGNRKNVYHIGGHLSEDEKLLTYPQDYIEFQASPSLHTLTTGLEDKRQHSITLLDKGIFEEKPTSTVYNSLDLFQSKAVVEAIPSLCAFDCLQGETCHSGSMFDEERMTENTSFSKGYSIMDCMLPKAHERTTLWRNDEVNTFPVGYALGTSLQSNNWHSSSILRIPDFDAEDRFTSINELDMEFEYRKSDFDTRDHTRMDVDHALLDNFPSSCHFTEQKLVSYSYSSSTLLYASSGPDLESEFAEEQHTFPLIQSTDKIGVELPSAVNVGLPKALDSLPLALYTASDLLPFKAHGLRLTDMCRRDISCSPKRSPLSLRRPGLKLEWKSSPLKFGREHSSSTNENFRFVEEQDNTRFNCIATEDRYYGREDRKSLMEVQSHVPADFPSLGLNKRDDIFGLLS